jgi:hypothetical protein
VWVGRRDRRKNICARGDWAGSVRGVGGDRDGDGTG